MRDVRGRSRPRDGRDTRGAEGRHRPLLRPRRVHCESGAARSRGGARRPPSVPRPRPCGARAARGHCGEVHRRCGHGPVRGAHCARGRPRARSPGGARDPRLRGRGRSRAAHRDHDRRGARLTRREPVRGRGDGVGGCRKHRRTASERRSSQRCGRGRDDSTRNAPRDRLPRDGPGRSEGKGQADRDLGGGRGARAIRAGSARPRGRRAGRPRARSRSAPDGPRRRARGALAAALDARRRPRHRQEPPAARTLPHRRRRGRSSRPGDRADASHTGTA